MPSTKRIFTLRLEDDDYDKMKVIAARDTRSMANYIEKLVKKEIAEYEAEHGPIKHNSLLSLPEIMSDASLSRAFLIFVKSALSGSISSTWRGE